MDDFSKAEIEAYSLSLHYGKSWVFTGLDGYPRVTADINRASRFDEIGYGLTSIYTDGQKTYTGD